MASSTDRSEDASALPRPELNPLVNQLLADNMGRWAEVYFTSPPEKREEAVVELLRELEAQKSGRETHPPSPQASPAVKAKALASSFESAIRDVNPDDLQHCDACGHDNPLAHQFCGMCGTELGSASEQLNASGHLATESPYNPQSAGNGHAGPPAYAESYSDYREPVEAEPLAPREELRRHPYDLSPFQTLLERENDGDFAYDDESPSGKYRYYIGAILAVLILVLGYVAWKGSRSDQSAQGGAPPPVPATTNTAPVAASPNSAAPVPVPPSKAEPQASPAASNPTPTTPKPAESPKQAESAARGTNTVARTPTPVSQPVADNVEYPSLQGNGSDEFAMAQRYLGATSGRARDSAEAAKWLWKSIAKHNGPAMLELADLYLKGDGVSKNCDQARVLLDSAARRGMAGAGGRLRNLQAFGCQ